MLRILLVLIGLAVALGISIVLLWLFYHAIRRLWRIVCLVVCFIGKTLATLWQTAFPKPPPAPKLLAPPRSTGIQDLLRLGREIAQLHAREQEKSPTKAAAYSQPKHPLPPPSSVEPLKPGENCLWVGDIRVIVREVNGRFEFETNPENRWNEAMSYLQDEGLMEKIVNRTIRWSDHQRPNQG